MAPVAPPVPTPMRRTSPHGTARTTTFQRPPKLNCQHSSRSDEFDTRIFSSRGSPGERSCQFAIRPSSVSGVRRHHRTNYSVVKCHLAPADSVGWMSCGVMSQNGAIRTYRIIVTMKQRRKTDTLCLCRVIGCICPSPPPPRWQNI